MDSCSWAETPAIRQAEAGAVMAGPWEKYKAAPAASEQAGPWSKYSAPVAQDDPADGMTLNVAGFDTGIGLPPAIARGRLALVKPSGTLGALWPCGLRRRRYEGR